MNKKIYLKVLMILLPLALSCVDKVDLSLPATELPIIVDGIITDEPGPDTVRLSMAYPADGRFHQPEGYDSAKVWITDNTGLVDTLLEIGQGNYITDQLVGVVGRTYQLSIRLPDIINGVPSPTLAVSTPQLLVEAGSIDSIYYEFTTYNNSATGLAENGFNVYLNSTLAPGSSRRLQWEFFGTYKAMTDPAALELPPLPCPNPPCPLRTLECARFCECCTCWYTVQENAPIVSNPKVLGGLRLDRVFIQYIPINRFTFYEQYRVEITQLELSEEVFEFYQAIRKQTDNGNSIFQPPFFELKGNITVQSGQMGVLGTFAASAITKRHIFIPRSAVPYQLTRSVEPADCRAIAENATLNKPAYWP